MPYQPEERKTELIEDIYKMSKSGDLNFLLTNLCIVYLQNHEKSYATLNDIVGALECCKQEFIRRVVNPYEDEKIKTNGDCYPQ